MKPTQDQINKWLHEAGGVAGQGDLLMINHETLRRFAELACAWRAKQDANLANKLGHDFKVNSDSYLACGNVADAILASAPDLTN